MIGWSWSDLLPGLCFLALAVGLAWALRRWYDPLPRRFLALFVLLVSLLFGSSLFGGRILLPLGNLTGAAPYRHLPPPPLGNWLQGDLIHQITPWALAVRRAVFDGRWPLWNARTGAGMPLLGDPQSQAFQPLVVAAYLLPVCRAAAVTSALRVFIGLTFAFLFLRRQQLGEPAALCGALAYGLGGFLMLWLGWPIGNAAALLPALLYAVGRCTGDRAGGAGRGAGGEGSRDAVLLFLVSAAVLLGGHPETQLYVLFCGGVFLLARVWLQSGWRERLSLLVRGGGAMGLAAAAMAPVLLPIAAYLPQTHRSTLIEFHLAARPLGETMEGLAREETRTAWLQEVAQRLLPVAAPRAFGDLEEYWGSENFIEDTSGCAGAAACFAALLALLPLRLSSPGGTRFPQERLAIGLLLVSLALIAQPPGFSRLFFRLPLVGATAIHRHHRLLLLVNLAVAWLAACQVERWARGQVRRSAVAATAAVAAGLIAWAYVAHPAPETGRVVWSIPEGGLWAQLLALGLAAALLLARPDRLPSRWAPRVVRWALPGVIAAELCLLHAGANSATPALYAYPTTPAIAFLQRALGPYRMMGLGQAFLPNLPLFYGLRDVRTDNPSLPAFYAGLTGPLSRDPMVPRFGRPGHPLYDLLSVRYVAARAGVTLPFPLVFRDSELWIYERPGALPLLFLPARARMHRGDSSWLAWVQENTDFAARTLVAPSEEHRRQWRSPPDDASTVTLTAFGPALLRAHASLSAPRLLASSIYQDGNWIVLDSGAPVPTTLTNGYFLGAWLPEGEHELRLLYRPRRFVAGCILAALALAAAAALWVPRPVLS